jgi:hypothetical protein
MPLFMFLSGYIAVRMRVFDKSQLIKKLKVLIIPFFSWYLINYFVSGSYKIVPLLNYFIRLIKAPDEGLWFLWILFVNFFLLYCGLKMEKFWGNKIYPIICFLLYLLPIDILGVGLLKWYFVFFISGYLIARYKNNLVKYKDGAYWAALIIFCTGIFFWSRLNTPYFILLLIKEIAPNSKLLIKLLPLAYRYAISFSGIATCFYITEKASRFKNLKYLIWLAPFTIDIYYFHFWFIYSVYGGGQNIAITFFIALAASLLLAYTIRKIKILDYLLFGRGKPIFSKNTPQELKPTQSGF